MFRSGRVEPWASRCLGTTLARVGVATKTRQVRAVAWTFDLRRQRRKGYIMFNARGVEVPLSWNYEVKSPGSVYERLGPVLRLQSSFGE